MSARDANVTCPCCQSRLEVDVRTGKVVKWRREVELDETGKPILTEADWTSAADRAGGRRDAAVEKFDAGVAREQKRETDLDDLFNKASEKLKKKGEDDPLSP
jgi:hypothetical protein